MDELKRAAAVRAADFVESGMALGLGTGSTIRFLLDELGARLADGRLANIRGIPTSIDTQERSLALGIPLVDLNEAGVLDLTIDGADEVDPHLDLIKGLGGALLREKIVASASNRVVIIVDESKVVTRLGMRSPLPVEVERFGANLHKPFLRDLGCEPRLRLDSRGGAFQTDGGNLIYDCHFPDGIEDAARLEVQLNNRPGILDNGLFLSMASQVVIAREDGSEILSRTPGN